MPEHGGIIQVIFTERDRKIIATYSEEHGMNMLAPIHLTQTFSRDGCVELRRFFLTLMDEMYKDKIQTHSLGDK